MDEQFDLIYMKDTLHHLEQRKEVVARLSVLLAPSGTIVIVEPNAWNPLIQLQMLRIQGFRTVVEKTDPATGERFVFGNERLVTGVKMRSFFKREGIHGKSKTIRFLSTKLSRHPLLVRIALASKRIHLEPVLCPLCIHTIYLGRKE